MRRIHHEWTKNGRLNVCEYVGKSRYRCVCDCGNTVYITGGNLKTTFSCGCLHKEMLIAMLKTHGESKTRLYQIWKAMRKRCNNPNDFEFANYGGRGISVCAEWSDYVTFKNWAIANGYSDEKSIDRINVNEGYSPHNCRWATSKEQACNKRSNVFITIGNETRTLSQWSELTGIPAATIRWRQKHGYIGADLLRKAYT